MGGCLMDNHATSPIFIFKKFKYKISSPWSLLVLSYYYGNNNNLCTWHAINILTRCKSETFFYPIECWYSRLNLQLHMFMYLLPSPKDFSVSWIPFLFTSAMATIAPSFANTWHTARPIPLPAPETWEYKINMNNMTK